MRPFQINQGILMMMNNVTKNINNYSYTQLEYFKRRINGEIDRLHRALYMTPVSVQNEINSEMIPKLENVVDLIEQKINDDSTDKTDREILMCKFSNLTNRLKRLNSEM